MFSLGFFSYTCAQEVIDISDKITYEGESALSDDAIKKLDSLQIDFQLSGSCYAFNSETNAKKSNGEAHSSNIAQPNNNKFKSNLLGLYLSEQEYQKVGKNNLGHTLYFINTTENNMGFAAQDSRLSIVTEVKDKNGQWTSIIYLPSSWCGNSYHTVTLGSNEYWEFVQPIFTGDFKTKLRYNLRTKDKIFISNEIDAFVDLGQLNKENKQGNKCRNLMNPYED